MKENSAAFPVSYRPGFLSRLGLLIVAQVLFLFAAIVLVVFVPDSPHYSGPSNEVIARFLDDLSDSLMAEDIKPDGLGGGTGGLGGLDCVLRTNTLFRSVVVYRTRPDKSEIVYAWKTGKPLGSEDSETAQGGSSSLDALGRLVATMPDGYRLHLTETNLIPVHLLRFSLPRSGSMVLVAEGYNDVLASGRTDLIRMIVLLFLVSTLVSLLIVHLLWKRLKEPLDRLTLQIEKTAQGETCPPELGMDEVELTRLAAGFNRLSESVKQGHVAARESDKKLHQADEALSESQQFLNTIINSSPSGLIVTDLSGRIILFSEAAAREFNCPSSEAVGAKIDAFFSIPEPAAGRTTPAVGFETVCWKRNGEAFPAYVITAPVESDGGAVMAQLYIVRDIVDSRGYQDMMVRLDRMATRGTMAGDIGHEINNFLAVLLGNLELLPRSIAKGDEPGIKKKFDTMKNNVEKIARFADGLMVESLHEEVTCAAVNMNQVVENVIAFLRYQNRFDGIDWVIQLQPDMPTAEIDDARVQQVLVNLLYNAAEAVGDLEGNHVLTVSTSLAGRAGVPIVHVDVRDNGTGVQKDKEVLLFKSRFTTKKRGHGIGLLTCRRIMDQHGGWIGYDYESGTHFWFELPLVHVATETPVSPQGVLAGA
jgi:PAS domain S-box-containing protein